MVWKFETPQMNFLHTLNFQLSKRGQCRHQMTQNQTVLLLFFKGNWSQNNGSLSLAETSGFCYENCKNVSSTKTNFLVSSFWIFNFRLFWVVEIKIYPPLKLASYPVVPLVHIPWPVLNKSVVLKNACWSGVHLLLIFKIRPNILIGIQKFRLRPKDRSRSQLLIYLNF